MVYCEREYSRRCSRRVWIMQRRPNSSARWALQSPFFFPFPFFLSSFLRTRDDHTVQGRRLRYYNEDGRAISVQIEQQNVAKITSLYSSYDVSRAVWIRCWRSTDHEFCIIGAGPGGLQLGHYMLSAGKSIHSRYPCVVPCVPEEIALPGLAVA